MYQAERKAQASERGGPGSRYRPFGWGTHTVYVGSRAYQLINSL